MFIKIRRPVYGIGINDADYVTQETINGVKYRCPFYNKWTRMLSRCYDGNSSNSSYFDCHVSEEWLRFSNFKRWMSLQNWEGRELDKDLLVLGNRVYGPDRCTFLPAEINAIFKYRARTTGFPLGVYPNRGKFRSEFTGYGIRLKSISYPTAYEAHRFYQKLLVEKIKLYAGFEDEPIKSALLARAARIQSHIDDGIETERV